VHVSSDEQLDDLLARVRAQACERGIPAVELVGEDGSILVVGQTQAGAVLLWIDPLGESMHSVGSQAAEGTVVLDYFGSYTEVPVEFVVPSDLGRAAAHAFFNGRGLVTGGLQVEPD
jgi:hypothetical protein